MTKQDIKILTCAELGDINKDVLRKTIQKMNSNDKSVVDISIVKCLKKI